MSHQYKEEATGAFYRARRGAILGVCRGVSNYSGSSVTWVRLAAILLTIVTGIWPALLIYLVVAFVMKPEPVLIPESDADWEFYNSMSTDRSRALSRLKRKFDDVDRRAQRLEHRVTSRGYEWDQRLRNGA